MTRQTVDRIDGSQVAVGHIVIPCATLDPTLAFFTDTLGFRIDAIGPADAPRTASLSGYGIGVVLETSTGGDPGRLRLACPDPALVADGVTDLTAPNGTRIEIVASEAPVPIPSGEQVFAVTAAADTGWSTGRAGLEYRDLIPSRFGGRFIASHIRLPRGGPVPDYVHFHRIRFQLIYCTRGWVRVVYEDQGEPFVMRAGDCVLQPPEIRHRVLESSPGLEVVEITCPAEHQTIADHELALPTGRNRPERDFGGQRFVRHVAADAAPGSRSVDGLEGRDLELGPATGGLVKAAVVTPTRASSPTELRHGGELLFLFVLEGTARIDCAGTENPLTRGHAVTVPADTSALLGAVSPDLELLMVQVGR